MNTRNMILALVTAAGLVTACAPTKQAEKRGGETPTTTQPAKGAKIGQSVKDGKFTFVVTKVSTRTSSIGPEGVGKKPQGKFVLVNMKVTNHGKEAQTFDGDSQKLLAGDKEYSADTEAAIYLESARSLLEEINPGNTVNGTVIFDVPTEVTPSAIELHDSPFSAGVRVNLR
ncbi:DUF4352 domain-containing protein [Actinomadura sp. NPDC023710]|uniref:DUF4352 domain-containing protein n=1 Tax=Actinomadura sp. NPDC023710 TaxID=3158219 RepID=UPI0033D38FEE